MNFRLINIFAALAVTVTSFAGTPDWAPVGDNIKTSWAETVDPACPLPEYPRPQMVRSEWLNLNGLWNYGVTDGQTSTFEAEGKILVPFAVESSLSGVGRRIKESEALWYEREFTVPKKWKGKNVLLHFGAVDWQADVYVNDVLLGTHKGGYDAFSFDITSALKKSGKQTLKVKVMDATDNSFQPRGKQCIAPYRIWYTPVTGIWQTVWLEPVAASHVKGFYAQSDIDNGTITVDVDASVADGETVKVALLEGGIGYSAETPSAAVLGTVVAENGKAVVKVSDVKTWSPESPYLYGVKITVERDGKVLDSVDGYTAMRKISVVKDSTPNHYRRLALNNEALFQFGPLDQGWWPDGLYTAPTDEALKYDIIKTKDFGYNMIRKHIKVEPARWFYWCDVYGMMVWQDMPCMGDHRMPLYVSKGFVPQVRDKEIDATCNEWARDSMLGGTDCPFPQEWKDNFYNEWKEIINQFKVFPCVVVWVPFNEGWGQFDAEKVAAFTKELDPSRLVNVASGGNLVLCGDILDVHHYPCPAMNTFEAKFANVIGEYGGIGYPVEGHLWKVDFKWGYGDVKKNGDEVLDLYDEYARMLEDFVKVGCTGAVYTQTTDVEGEVNGMITYDRKVVKIDEARLKAINERVIKAMAK